MLLKILNGTTSRVLQVGLSFLITLMLSRALSVEGFGAYAIVTSVLAILIRLVTLGTPEMVIRTIAAAEKSNRLPAIRGIFRFAIICSVSVLTLVLAVFLLTRDLLGLPSGSWTATILVTVSLLTPLSAFSEQLSSALNGLGRIKDVVWRGEFLKKVLLCLLLALAFWVIGAEATLERALFLTAFSTMAILCLRLFLLRRAIATLPQTSGVTTNFSAWSREAPILGLVGMTTIGFQHADILMLGMLANTEEVGLYHVANRLSNTLSFFTSAAVIILGPKVAAHFRQNETAAIRKLVFKMSSTILMLVMPIVPLFFLLGERFISALFGPEYLLSIPSFKILIVAQLPFVLIGIFSISITMMGEGKKILLGSASALIINVIGNALLIPSLGAVGASIATSLTWVALAVFYFLIFRAVLARRPH